MLFLENLLALPNALWKSRVFKYLSLSDFVKLDIAATANHICKLLTIQLFEDYSCNKRTPIPHPRLLQWMAKRKVQPRRIILNSKVDQHYVDQLRKLSRCNLNTLYLADINDIQFVDIADIVVELLCLELRSPSLTEDSFNRIQFSKLQWLSLTDNANLTDAGITQITEACQELYYLSFTSCPYITDQTIFTAARNCSSLAGLVLRNQQMVSSAGIKQLMAQMGARSSFTCLKLIECNNVSDDAFVAGLCSSLVHLDIVGNPLVTTHTLRAVATNCPLLEHLDLQRCSSDELTGEGVEYVAKGCLSLSFINLSYTACATASAVTALATLCPRLAFIGLLSASLCGDKQISDLQDLCSRNRQLQILHLGQCDIPSELSLLDFAEAFANCSPKELRVDRVKNLADSFVACISQGCSSLSILDIKDCPDITGVGVSLLCRKLVQLALDTLPLLPVNELLSIARNSWFLQVLTLCNLSDSISDQDFANFFIEDHCAHLSEVFFQNIRIGKTTLQSMPSRKLRKIVVDSTEKFAPIYAIKLVEAFSAIELLFVSSCGSCLYDSSKGTHLLAPAVDALLVDPQQLGLPAGVPVTPATQLANSAHSVNYSLQMEGGLNNTPDPDAHDPPDPPIPQGWWSPRCTKVKYSDVETEMLLLGMSQYNSFVSIYQNMAHCFHSTRSVQSLTDRWHTILSMDEWKPQIRQMLGKTKMQMDARKASSCGNKAPRTPASPTVSIATYFSSSAGASHENGAAYRTTPQKHPKAASSSASTIFPPSFRSRSSGAIATSSRQPSTNSLDRTGKSAIVQLLNQVEVTSASKRRAGVATPNFSSAASGPVAPAAPENIDEEVQITETGPGTSLVQWDYVLNLDPSKSSPFDRWLFGLYKSKPWTSGPLCKLQIRWEEEMGYRKGKIVQKFEAFLKTWDKTLESMRAFVEKNVPLTLWIASTKALTNKTRGDGLCFYRTLYQLHNATNNDPNWYENLDPDLNIPESREAFVAFLRLLESSMGEGTTRPYLSDYQKDYSVQAKWKAGEAANKIEEYYSSGLNTKPSFKLSYNLWGGEATAEAVYYSPLNIKGTYFRLHQLGSEESGCANFARYYCCIHHAKFRNSVASDLRYLDLVEIFAHQRFVVYDGSHFFPADIADNFRSDVNIDLIFEELVRGICKYVQSNPP